MKLTKYFVLILFFISISNGVRAEMAADEVARLGVDLTPLGGEKAGNADGTIPAWASWHPTSSFPWPSKPGTFSA